MFSFSRLAEVATVAVLGVAILVGGAQADHTDGWPWWAIPAMVVGAFIIALAALNLLFGILDPPIRWVVGTVLRLRFGLAPMASGEALRTLHKERDDLQKALLQESQRVQYKDKKVDEQEQQIGSLQPLADWAKELIERERGSPWTYLSHEIRMRSLNLKDREPYIEVAIWLKYIGIFDLIIGERQSGRLSWHNTPFSIEPELSMVGVEPSPPFKLRGPTGGELRLRQFVTLESAREIQAYLDAGVGEIEFEAKDFDVSLSIASFDGEILANGRLFGEYLTVPLLGTYKIPVEVEPSLGTTERDA